MSYETWEAVSTVLDIEAELILAGYAETEEQNTTEGNSLALCFIFSPYHPSE